MHFPLHTHKDPPHHKTKNEGILYNLIYVGKTRRDTTKLKCRGMCNLAAQGFVSLPYPQGYRAIVPRRNHWRRTGDEEGKATNCIVA